MYEVFRSFGLKVSLHPVLVETDEPPRMARRIRPWECWEQNNPEDDYDAQMEDLWTEKKVHPDLWYGSEGEERRKLKLAAMGKYIDYEEVHWLNEFGHMEPQLSYVAVSDEQESKPRTAISSPWRPAG